MKKILLSLLLLPLLCHGQIYQSLKPIEGRGQLEQGVYYKDINNVFNGFEGIYEYTGNDFSLKIILKKILMVGGYFYEDMMIGQYQYVKDGISIDYFNDPLNADDAKITSSWIRQPTPLFCPTCLPEKWLVGDMFDPITKRSCTIYVAKKIQNGEAGIQIWFYYPYGPQMPWESDEAARLPVGEIFMKKI